MRTKRRSSANPAVASLQGLWSTAREASSSFVSYVSSAAQFGNSRITRFVFSPAPVYCSELHVGHHQFAPHQLVQNRISDVGEGLVVRRRLARQRLIEADPIHVPQSGLAAERRREGKDGEKRGEGAAHEPIAVARWKRTCSARRGSATAGPDRV